MATERATLRPDQEEDVAKILETDRTLCANDLGTGKTVLGAEAVHRSGAQRVLIVAPLVTFKGWAKWIKSQTGRDLRVINSKKAGVLAFKDFTDGHTGLYITNWEFMRNIDWSPYSVEFLILDEVHRISNRKALQSKAIKKLEAERILALSATPWGNRIEGAWSVLNALWPKEFPHFWPWVTKYLRTERDRYSPGPKPAGEKEAGIVVRSVPSWLMRKAPYDIPLAVHEIPVTLPPAQMKVYRQFEQEAVVWLQNNPLIAEYPAVKYARLRQLTLAVPTIKYGEDGEPIVYFEPDAKSAKIEALLNVVADLPEGEPGLVWTSSKQFSKIVCDRLQQKGYTAALYNGDTSKPERSRIEDEFGHTLQFIVATQATAGTGLDGLQRVCRVEHVLSLDDNRVNNTQAWGRLSRGGQERRVNRFVYRAEDTIEERQMDRLISDEQLMQESMNVYQEEKKAA